MSETIRSRDIQRFFQELEQGMREITSEHIHTLIPELTRATILSLEVSVAHLRARYLKAACSVDPDADGDEANPSDIQALREKREAYEELRKAHEALMYAVERRYVDVEGLESE
jgi:hypothetical protein